jgi:ribosomal protein S18 acetylase RimI-like enzyme
MKITQRPASKSDEDFARDTHHKAFQRVVTEQFGAWDEAVQDQFFYSAWNARPSNILLCDDKPCGYAIIEEKPDSIYIGELVIHPAFQGKNIGTTILNDVFKKAAIKKLPVKLQVLHKNKAQLLYKKLGFVQTGQTDTHILMERPSP